MAEAGKTAGKEAAKAAEGIIAKVAKDTLREADDVAKTAGKGTAKAAEKDASRNATQLGDEVGRGAIDEPSGTAGRFGTKTDRLKEHLTEKDLDAARRELNGEVVARKPNGQPWDHVDEVRNAQRGLVNRINQLKRQLGDSRTSDADRSALESELSEASRLLDHSKQYVPRS